MQAAGRADGQQQPAAGQANGQNLEAALVQLAVQAAAWQQREFAVERDSCIRESCIFGISCAARSIERERDIYIYIELYIQELNKQICFNN